MLPRKVKIKKPFLNFCVSPIFFRINFNFFGCILSLRLVNIFEISLIFLIFFHTLLYMTYLKKKRFHLSEGSVFKFFDTKASLRLKKRLKLQDNAFPNMFLEFFCHFKTVQNIASGQNHNLAVLRIFCPCLKVETEILLLVTNSSYIWYGIYMRGCC